MKNLTIKVKLRLFFLLLVVAFIAFSVLVINCMNVINQKSLEIETKWLPSIIAINNITRNTSRFRMLVTEFLLTDEISEKNQFERELTETLESFDEWQTKYESLIGSQEERATYEKFSQLFDSYAVTLQQTLEASRQNKFDEGAQLLKQAFQTFSDLRENLNKLIEINQENTVVATQESSRIISMSQNTIIVGVILVLVFSLFAMITLEKAISVPLATTKEIIQRLTAGDTTVTIPMQNKEDEIGQINQATATIVTTLKRLTGDLQSMINTVQIGELSVHIDVGQHQGEFANLVRGVNNLIETLKRPLSEVVEVMQHLSRGDLKGRMVGHYEGELQTLKINVNDSLEKLTEAMGETKQVTETTLQGDLSQRISLVNKEGFFLELSQGLNQILDYNQRMSAENSQQDWLKSGQAELNKVMSGDQDIATLAKNIISFLTTYLEAKVGLLYLLQEGKSSTEPSFLQVIATYAYTPPANFPEKFMVGEGLVGEVALKRQAIVCSHTPEEYTYIVRSSLSHTIPRHVLIVPILHENTLKGVIELGAIEPLTGLQQEFLTQALVNIGIAVNTAEARTRMQILLKQSQSQSQELQRLNEELQSQTEELRTQQEELNQNNEELKARSHDLEQQKDEIRKKNLLLEQTQAAIEIKAKELETASKYKSEFLANMSHELRTPLNSILVLAQTLARNSEGNLTERQIEHALIIHQSGNDLLTLINDVLDLSKIEAGKMDVHLEEMPLTDLVENIRRKFTHVAEGKGLDFQTRIADDLPLTIRTDAQRLSQIITNLLSNAFKFTAEGTVQLVVEHPLEEERVIKDLNPNEMIAIRVIDSGIGIAKSKQQLIFEAFQQADGTTSRHYGGTGLGLSISREFSKLLNGKLGLISEEGKGSTFTLYLPATYPQVLPAKNPENDQPPLPPENFEESEPDTTLEHNTNILAGKKALIVDDDQRNSFALTIMLDEIGMTTFSYNSGQEALAFLKAHQDIDIVLMDIMMPEMDGYETMQKIREEPHFRKLPIIALTAKAMKDDRRRCIDSGASDYLTKPVDTNKLISLMRVWLYQ